MDVKEIKSIMALMSAYGVTKFDYREGDRHYHLERQPVDGESSGLSVADADDSDSRKSNRAATSTSTIKAPLVGIYYTATNPGEGPLVKVGDHIKKGQTVGVIEAMKMMHNIVSDKEGTITKICVGNGETVEYDQDLLEVSLD